MLFQIDAPVKVTENDLTIGGNRLMQQIDVFKSAVLAFDAPGKHDLSAQKLCLM